MNNEHEVLADKALAQQIKEVFDLHKSENEVLVLVQSNKKPEIYLSKFNEVITKNTNSGGGNLILVTRNMVEKLPIDFVKTEQPDSLKAGVRQEFSLPMELVATEIVGEVLPEVVSEVLPEVVANEKGKKHSFSIKV